MLSAEKMHWLQMHVQSEEGKHDFYSNLLPTSGDN